MWIPAALRLHASRSTPGQASSSSRRRANALFIAAPLALTCAAGVLVSTPAAKATSSDYVPTPTVAADVSVDERRLARVVRRAAARKVRRAAASTETTSSGAPALSTSTPSDSTSTVALTSGTTTPQPVPTPQASTASPTPVTPPADAAPTAVARSDDRRPFAGASFWRQSIRTAPLASNSTTLVADLDRQVDSLYGGTAAFNSHAFSVGFHVAAPGTPRVDVEFYDCQGKGWLPTGVYDGQAHWRQVPIPADAEVAPGTDKNLTVWSPSTDQLWEFWIAERTGSGWRACWGGRIDNVSTSRGYFEGGFGASATGLSLAGGMVGVDEVREGRIDHAMTLNVFAAASWQQFSWPAQRSDGHDPEGRNPILEGTRFRLDPSLNVTQLNLHPIAQIIAAAAQEYGFVVQDTGGAVAVVAQSGVQEAKRTGVDPWTELQKRTPDYQILAGFPWDRLQALPTDYGKP